MIELTEQWVAFNAAVDQAVDNMLRKKPRYAPFRAELTSLARRQAAGLCTEAEFQTTLAALREAGRAHMK